MKFSKPQTPVDARKRQTLKYVTGLSGSVALAGLSLGSAGASEGVAAAAVSSSATGAAADIAAQGSDLGITLISSPDVLDNHLVVRNLTDQAIRVDRFYCNKVVFNGELTDCNGALARRPIVLQAGQQASYVIDTLNTDALSSPAGDFLDADVAAERLPNGTSVVSLSARLLGNEAVLELA